MDGFGSENTQHSHIVVVKYSTSIARVLSTLKTCFHWSSGHMGSTGCNRSTPQIVRFGCVSYWINSHTERASEPKENLLIQSTPPPLPSPLTCGVIWQNRTIHHSPFPILVKFPRCEVWSLLPNLGRMPFRVNRKCQPGRHRAKQIPQLCFFFCCVLK